MPLSEEDWLRQIAADRDNDGLRLVFADWLEEHGDAARAEFIRLAALPEKTPEYWALRKRESDLLREHRAAWLRDLWVAPRNQCVFRRGFVDEITCKSSRWLQGAGRLLRVCPLLQSLTLRITKTNDVIKLASSPHLTRLTTLALRGVADIDEAGVKALASSPYLAQLLTLDLGGRKIGDTGAAALASSTPRPRLNVLILWFNSIGDAGASALAASPYLKRLTTIDLSANNIGNVGASALAASPRLARLATLRLAHNRIGDVGMSALGSSPYLARLTRLDLDANRIGDAGALALASSPHLGRLATIDLTENQIGETAKAALRKRFGDAVQF
ncbi:MAG TPA: TIGR02996 domain-containing protein [Gemmataceae bacterium]|jgi:uncharacterized protein (TIGR02996 family)